MSAQPAARLGDKVAHTMALPGALMGLLAGAAIGAAIIATGGLGAIAIGAALATTGGLGMAGQYIGESIDGPPTGAIVTGSSTIFINGLPAARATLSTALCREGPPQMEATGAETVYFDGMPAGRKGEKLTCSAKIIEGSGDVFIGGPSVQTEPMDPEVPAWLSTTMQVMAIGGTILATGGIAATYGVGAALGSLAGGFGGGYLGAMGGRWAADKMGFGETGQRIAEVLGGFGGGMIGGGAGFKGGRAAMNRAIPNPTTPTQGFLRGGMQGRQAVLNSRGVQGSVTNANFAQSRIRADRSFSQEGQQKYSRIAGESIRTVDDLSGAIRSGKVKPSDIPVDYVDVNGNRLILNTRTSTALQDAGVPREQWHGVNRTGQEAFPGTTYEQLALDQLRRNKLPPTGSPGIGGE